LGLSAVANSVRYETRKVEAEERKRGTRRRDILWLVPLKFCPRYRQMTRHKRKASGFDQNHPFWPEALSLWRQGYSNAQVAAQAQAQGFDLNEDQVRYSRKIASPQCCKSWRVA